MNSLDPIGGVFGGRMIVSRHQRRQDGMMAHCRQRLRADVMRDAGAALASGRRYAVRLDESETELDGSLSGAVELRARLTLAPLDEPLPETRK